MTGILRVEAGEGGGCPCAHTPAPPRHSPPPPVLSHSLLLCRLLSAQTPLSFPSPQPVAFCHTPTSHVHQTGPSPPQLHTAGPPLPPPFSVERGRHIKTSPNPFPHQHAVQCSAADPCSEPMEFDLVHSRFMCTWPSKWSGVGHMKAWVMPIQLQRLRLMSADVIVLDAT